MLHSAFVSNILSIVYQVFMSCLWISRKHEIGRHGTAFRSSWNIWPHWYLASVNMWWLSKSSHGHKRSHHKLTTHLSMVQRWPDDHLCNGESIIKVCTRSYHVFNILCVWSKHVNELFTLIVKDAVCDGWRFEEHHTHITGKCQSADETKRRNINRVFSSYYSSCAWKVIPAQNETHPCGVCHDLETHYEYIGSL